MLRPSLLDNVDYPSGENMGVTWVEQGQKPRLAKGEPSDFITKYNKIRSPKHRQVDKLEIFSELFKSNRDYFSNPLIGWVHPLLAELDVLFASVDE